jgi:hypothetical protein
MELGIEGPGWQRQRVIASSARIFIATSAYPSFPSREGVFSYALGFHLY